MYAVDYLKPFQTGFRPEDGTERALVMLLNDLKNRIGIVHPFFNAIDHGILLDWMEVGITILYWFFSSLGVYHHC